MNPGDSLENAMSKKVPDKACRVGDEHVLGFALEAGPNKCDAVCVGKSVEVNIPRDVFLPGPASMP